MPPKYVIDPARIATVLTSCGRFDLLEETVSSFLKFFDASSIVIAEDSEGNEVTIPCDSIVLANMEPNRELEYTDNKREVYVIGDAIATRRANGAIHDGYRLAMTL